MQSAIGTVESVENRQGSRGPFPIAHILVDGWSKPENFAFFGNSARDNIFDAVGKRIEFTYEEKQNGKYTNRYLQAGWSYLPASQQAAPSGQSSPRVITPQGGGTDSRQESIERQSSMAQAVNLVSAMLASGVSFVPVDGGKKSKAAASDPEVVFETVKQFAARIKHHVQQGDWTNAWVADEPEQTEDEDMPF